MTSTRRKPVQRRVGSSYSKSAETRKAILRAAIEAFGQLGYGGATTRQIALSAGVNQPAINYHFGGKNALYKACAEEILASFTGPLGDVSQQAFAATRTGLDRQSAADQLMTLLSALADVMMQSEAVSAASGFVGREMREPGLAYNYLYKHLWAPGIELAARLIAVVKGRKAATPPDQVDAIMMISGISAFVPGLSVSMQYMGWKEAGDEGRALVLERLQSHIQGWLQLPSRAGRKKG